MTHRTLAHLAGALLVLGALLHLAIPVGGPSWYAFFGAPPPLVAMAATGAWRPVLTCVFIASVLGVLAAYVYSTRLPLRRAVLLLAGVGLLARGVLFLPVAHWRPELLASLCGECGQANLFLVVTSALCVVVGVGLLAAAKPRPVRTR